jgi:hypothetical protein
MGIAPTGKRVTIRYMDFWKVEDGRITDNWVMVDFPGVLAQLGVDVFRRRRLGSYSTGVSVNRPNRQCQRQHDGCANTPQGVARPLSRGSL